MSEMSGNDRKAVVVLLSMIVDGMTVLLMDAEDEDRPSLSPNEQAVRAEVIAAVLERIRVAGGELRSEPIMGPGH